MPDHRQGEEVTGCIRNYRTTQCSVQSPSHTRNDQKKHNFSAFPWKVFGLMTEFSAHIQAHCSNSVLVEKRFATLNCKACYLVHAHFLEEFSGCAFVVTTSSREKVNNRSTLGNLFAISKSVCQS